MFLDLFLQLRLLLLIAVLLNHGLHTSRLMLETGSFEVLKNDEGPMAALNTLNFIEDVTKMPICYLLLHLCHL